MEDNNVAVLMVKINKKLI